MIRVFLQQKHRERAAADPDMREDTPSEMSSTRGQGAVLVEIKDPVEGGDLMQRRLQV